LPEELVADKKFWDKRYRSINDLEKHLYRNGTRILKFFLHLSKEEQRLRFLKRVEDPAHNWKFSRFDLVERGFWKEYQDAYEVCLSTSSTEHASWYVVPADDKLNARLIISQVVTDTLNELKMEFPKPDLQRMKQLRAFGKLLAK
jgi:polyphosphate kinase 2 (PPK2 family)